MVVDGYFLGGREWRRKLLRRKEMEEAVDRMMWDVCFISLVSFPIYPICV